MKLDSLKITHFRCLKDFEIQFSKGITVVIGKNGAGKTTLLNSIRYSLSLFFSDFKKYGGKVLSSGNPDLKRISVTPFDFYLAPDSDIPEVELNIHSKGRWNDAILEWDYNRRSTSGASRDVSLYVDAYEKFMEEYEHSDMLPVMAFYSDSFPHKDVRLSDFARSSIKEQGLMKRNFGYYKWADEVSCASIWQLRLANMLIRQTVEDNSLEEIDYVVNKLTRISTPILSDNDDNDYIISKVFTQVDEKGQVNLFFKLNNGQIVMFDNLPAGYKRIYSIALDLAYRMYILRKNQTQDPPGIVMIDEVDLHLHPSLEVEILQRLRETFPTLQFIVTTHSPSVLNNLPLSDGDNVIYKIEPKKSSATEISNLYRLDYATTVYNIMETPWPQDDVQEQVDSIVRLKRLEKTRLAQNRIDELKNMVSSDRFRILMEQVEQRVNSSI